MLETLILNLPYFDRTFQIEKEMQSGIGYKKPRTGNLNLKRNLRPICDMLYAAAVLKKEKINFFFDDDQSFDSKNIGEYLERLEKKNLSPEIVFIRTSIGTLNSDIEISKILKEKWSKAKFICYGPVFSSNEILSFIQNELFYDGIVTSEIESVIVDIIKGYKNIPGFYSLNSNKYTIENREIKYTNMDSLPPPAYELINYKELNEIIIQTQRGCPVGCSYCPYFLSQKNKFRARTPKNVVKEIIYLLEKFKIKKFIIHDPILSLDRKRLEEICKLILKNKIKIQWQCETHLNHIDEALLSLMKKAGCYFMSMGIESANSDVLETVNRRFKNWEKAKKIIKFCKSINIKTRGYFILGLPKDNINGVFMSIELSKYLDLDYANFNLPIPIPGTQPYYMGIEQKLLDTNLRDNNPRIFYESLSKHNWDNDFSLTKDITNKQLKNLFKIAIHSFSLHKEKQRFSLKYLKIIFYKFMVKIHGLTNLKFKLTNG